jgi:hypothetical protein
MENIKKQSKGEVKLLPSDFYYNEKGLLVFTKDYHLKRGYCCGNNCVNCPYTPKSIKGNKII